MGANNSKTIQSTATFVSNATFNSVIKTQNIQRTSTTVNQSQVIDVSTDTSVLLACIQILGPSGYDCSKLMANGSFSGISQVAAYDITAKTQLSDSDTTKVQNDMTAAIQAKMAESSDDVGAALKSIATAAGGNNSSSTSLNQSVTNIVTNNFTKDTLNEMISSYASGQSQVFKVTNSKATASGFSQSLQVKALTEMVASNATIREAVNKVDAKLAGDVSTKDKGLTDIVDSVGDTIGDGIGSFTSMGKVLIIGGVACVCVIPIMIMALGKSGAIKAAENLGGKALDNMPQAQAGKIAQSLL